MEFSRKKSCSQCRTAKTRCSLDIPSCVRCTNRNLACSYEVPPRRPNVPAQASSFNNWLPGTTPLPTAGPVPDAEELSAYRCPIFGSMQHRLFPAYNESSLVPFARPALNTPGASNRYESEVGVPSVPGKVSVPTNQKDVQPGGDAIPDRERSWLGYFSYGSKDGSKDDDSALTLAAPVNANGENAGDTAMPDPPPGKAKSKFILANWQALKRIPDNMEHILTRRPVNNMGDLMRANFLQSVFESYIFAFDKNELPPFIHRSSIMNDVGTQEANFAHLPEALANCKAIVSLSLHKTGSTGALVLKTLLLEIQRIHDEKCRTNINKIRFREYDESGLLHCLQALTLYSILLARDELRYDLIGVVTRITISEIGLLAQRNGFASLHANSVFPDWEDWVREQSKIRTTLLLYLMIRIFNMDIGNPNPEMGLCYGFEQVPLPCSKSLWEAQTASTWQIKYREYLLGRKRTVALTVGDLKKSINVDIKDLDLDMVKDLSIWSGEVDGFGAVLLNCGLL